jgi:hypothetical protein
MCIPPPQLLVTSCELYLGLNQSIKNIFDLNELMKFTNHIHSIRNYICAEVGNQVEFHIFSQRCAILLNFFRLMSSSQIFQYS